MLTTQRVTVLLPILLACAVPAVAWAQTAYLQDSGIVGEGKTLSISRLPVADANGNFTYNDVVIGFSVSATGVLTQAGKAKITPSPNPQTDGFIPGRYYVKSGNNATQFGSLTSGVGSGGSTIWTLVMDVAPTADFPNQASWQTGTPAPDVAARLSAAKVPLDPNDSYGITAVGNHLGCYNGFTDNNGLMAAEQVNNTLTLMSYTDCGSNDRSYETASIILGRCTDNACSNAPQ